MLGQYTVHRPELTLYNTCCAPWRLPHVTTQHTMILNSPYYTVKNIFMICNHNIFSFVKST